MSDARDPYERELAECEIDAGVHRDYVGGRWEELGRLQFRYLCSQGLLPHHRLMDIGCGSLRGGVHFAHYLDPGGYYGVDRNASLLKAGLDVELQAARVGPAGQELDLRPKLDPSHLLHTALFEFDR